MILVITIIFAVQIFNSRLKQMRFWAISVFIAICLVNNFLCYKSAFSVNIPNVDILKSQITLLNEHLKGYNVLLIGKYSASEKVFDTYSYVSTILSFDVQIPAIDSSKDEKGVICASAEYSKDGITCMKHLNKSTKCEVGDIISTFSHSNYPEELPIEKIKEIIYEKNGMSCIALIEPFENVNCIKDVVIVKRNK